MSEEPLISVIIPVYKVENYLRACLDSVVSQSYVNLEIILVDDGSPDACGAICDEYSRKDKRIKVFHVRNGGVSIARNMGIEHSSGSFISFIDSDDLICPNFYDTLVRNLNKSSADTSAALLREVPADFKLKNFQAEPEGDIRVFDGSEPLNHILDPHTMWVGYPVNKIYCADIIKNNNIRFDRYITLNEDSLFNVAYFQYAKKTVLTSAQMYLYRILPGSATRTALLSPAPLETKMTAYEKIADIAKTYPKSVFQKRVCAEYVTTAFAYLKNLARLGRCTMHDVKKVEKRLSDICEYSFFMLPPSAKLHKVLLKISPALLLGALKMECALNRKLRKV